MRTMNHIGHLCLALAGMGLAMAMPLTAQAIEFGDLNVIQHDPYNNVTSVTVTVAHGTSGVSIPAGLPNRGDYNVVFGGDHSDDFTGGVLLSYVSENGRNNFNSSYEGDGDPDQIIYATSASAWSSNGYYIPVNASPGGGEFNSNVALAYFPFSEGWIAGAAYNSANGGDITSLNATPGIDLGDEFKDRQHSSEIAGGTFLLSVPGIDTRQDGLLFVQGAKNEDNYALSQPLEDGSGWIIGCHDNGANGGSYEQDPVAFAYLPYGTDGVTMGRVSGSGWVAGGQGDFTITHESVGRYRLTIDGKTPGDGTLLVSAEGFVSYNADNTATFQPDGDGWVIETRDIAGMGLQSSVGEIAFNFAFLDLSNPPTAPGTAPTVSGQTQAVHPLKVQITEINGAANTYFDITTASTGSSEIRTIGGDKGDCPFGWTPKQVGNVSTGQGIVAESDGVILATISEWSRDNSATGGPSGYGVVNTDGSVHTSQADGTDGNNSEMNINFDMVLFTKASGFRLGSAVPTTGETADNVTVLEDGKVFIAFDGFDTRNDGVLIVNGYGNEDNYTNVEPTADGTGYLVTIQDNNNAPGSYEAKPINYVLLPYETEGLVAGQIAADGSVLSGTDGFSLTKESEGTYRLHIDGATPDDGALLLSAMFDGTVYIPEAPEEGEEEDPIPADYYNYAVYKDSGDGDFLIRTIDMVGAGTPEDVGFSFAFIKPDMVPVPEPSTVVLLLLGTLAMAGSYRWRR